MLEPEAAVVADRAPGAGDLAEPTPAPAFVLAQLVVEQVAEGGQLTPLLGGEVGRDDQQPTGQGAELLEVGDGPVEVVEQPGAEDRVEAAVGSDVADVVLNEAEVGQPDPLGDPLAGGEVPRLALDPEHLVTGPCEEDRVAALEAAKVGDPSPRRAELADRAQVGLRDRLVADPWRIRQRPLARRQLDVVRGEVHSALGELPCFHSAAEARRVSCLSTTTSSTIPVRTPIRVIRRHIDQSFGSS